LPWCVTCKIMHWWAVRRCGTMAILSSSELQLAGIMCSIYCHFQSSHSHFLWQRLFVLHPFIPLTINDLRHT
jgi:hypothetical protein